MVKVYVSSTVADLKQERRAVLDWLMAARHQVVHSYRPSSEMVRDDYLDDVDTCDLYVLIVGHRYGFQPPPENNPEGLSITHLEFRRAGQCGIPRIALLRTSIPDVNLSDIADPKKLALVLAFRDEVAREVRTAGFGDDTGLIQGLDTEVQAELAKLSALGQRRGIFLNYRREDTGPYARLLQRDLRDGFPDSHVFMDLDSIEAGVNVAQAIRDAVASSAVLVALIGRQWSTLTDKQGQRRLDDPDDYIRFELRTALQRRVRVIPVLIDGTEPLRQEDLPAELEALVQLNALELSYTRYEYDAGRLLKQIQRLLAPADKVAVTERKAREEADRKARDEGELAVLDERARSAAEAGAPAAARDQYAALLRVRERVSGPEDPKTLTARAYLANWTGQAGDPAAARDQLTALLRVRERVSGPEDPETLRVRNNLADNTGRAGDPAAARDQLTALLRVRERVSGPEDPETLRVRNNLADHTGRAGDPAAARDQLAALLPVYERVLGSEHPETLRVRSNLVLYTGRAGDQAAARDQYAALLPVRERVSGPEHPETLHVRNNLALFTGLAGDPVAARDQIAALLPVYERVLGPEHPATLNTRNNLALFTGQAGDPAAARDQYAVLVPVRERVSGPKHPDTVQVRKALTYWTRKARR